MRARTSAGVIGLGVLLGAVACGQSGTTIDAAGRPQGTAAPGTEAPKAAATAEAAGDAAMGMCGSSTTFPVGIPVPDGLPPSDGREPAVGSAGASAGGSPGAAPSAGSGTASSPAATPEEAQAAEEYWTPERMAEANRNGEPPGAFEQNTPASEVTPPDLAPMPEPAVPTEPASPIDAAPGKPPVNVTDPATGEPGVVDRGVGGPDSPVSSPMYEDPGVPCPEPGPCAIPGGPPVTFADGSGCMPGSGPAMTDPGASGSGSGSGTGGGTNGFPGYGDPCVPASSTTAVAPPGSIEVDCGVVHGTIDASLQGCVSAPATTAVGTKGGGDIVCAPTTSPVDPSAPPLTPPPFPPTTVPATTIPR